MVRVPNSGSFAKGNIPWNKGKKWSSANKSKARKLWTPEMRKQAAINAVKRKVWSHSDDFKKSQRLRFIGIKLSAEHKAKISVGNIETWKDEAYRAKHIPRLLSYRAEGRNHNTKPERFMKSILTTNGIKFNHNVCTIFGRPDFFIEPNNCLFVDGDYWHSRPSQMTRDTLVNKTLRSQGYKVKRVRDYSIYDSPMKVLKEVRNWVSG